MVWSLPALIAPLHIFLPHKAVRLPPVTAVDLDPGRLDGVVSRGEGPHEQLVGALVRKVSHPDAELSLREGVVATRLG